MDNPNWDDLKSQRLKKVRGASFDEVLGGRYIGTFDHHNRQHQKVMLFKFKGYVWVVPFVEKEGIVFLKTLYPSRKYTKLYRKEI